MNCSLIPFTHVLEKIIDNRGKSCPTANSGIPLIATNCITNDNLYPVFEKVRYVTKETYDSWFRGHPHAGDLIFVTKGTPGRVAMVPNPVKFCIAQDAVVIRANKDLIDPNYLFAVLRSRQIQEQINNLHVGSLIPHFKKGDFDKLLLPIPKMVIQKQIGALYLDFSKKIELNNQTNQTLVAIAKTIFKEWFIDFGPVKSKAEGKRPFGMDDKTAALFPDTFEKSELGMIPKGWQILPLGEVVTCFDSKRIPLSGAEREKRKGPYPYYGAASLMGFLDEYIFDGKYVLMGEDGSVLNPDGTPVLQYVWGKLWVNNHAHVLKGNGISEEHLLLALKNVNLNAYTTGAVQLKLNQGNMNKIPFLYANEAINKKFAEIISPLFEKYRHNEDESKTLISLRDLLLSKLVSGEIELKG